MDEVYIVTVRGERLYLWRAVDQDGDVLDILVQKRKYKGAAVRFFKKLMKGQERSSRKIVTDKLLKLRGGEKRSHAFFNALPRSLCQ
jgi:putative transposase